MRLQAGVGTVFGLDAEKQGLRRDSGGSYFPREGSEVREAGGAGEGAQ